MDRTLNTHKPGLLYRLFKAYLRLIHDKLYYRHTYRLNLENVPPDGTPLLIVSNHQNCLNDPLGILFTIRDRKPNFITRADIFAKHPLINKFLRSIGLFPAFRIKYEGEEALSNNKETFLITEHALINGRTIVMFPESGHQDKHWLGDFTFGYTKLAFEAAALNNFETDVFILPSCNHYADYFHIQEQFLVKFGKPVSLSPYYNLYKVKPRTAQRKVNVLVREQINELMLNIQDVDNYHSINFLRKTYGKKFAERNGYDYERLPDRLLSDKAFVATLEKAKTIDENGLLTAFREALILKKGIKDLKIRDELFEKTPSMFQLLLLLISFIILFPIWIFSLWPNALHFILPHIILDRMNDKLFYGTFLYACSAIITIPVLYLLSFIIVCFYFNFWIALIYVALLPMLGLFAWYYRKFFIQTVQAVRFRANEKKAKLKKLRNLRTKLHNQLDTLIQGVK